MIMLYMISNLKAKKLTSLLQHVYAMHRAVYWAPEKSFIWIIKIPHIFLTFLKFQYNFLTSYDFS